MTDLAAMYGELRNDQFLFAKHCLRIRDKLGNIVPLIYNSAQTLLHETIERQVRETGRVRIIVPKGRQQGISTYFASRFYWKTALRRGQNTYILAHEQSASEALFGIVERYHRYNPLAPTAGTSNVRELVFDKLESSYTVSTAGSKAGGRGKSMTNFHGSEVAFWPNAREHFAASVQTVPDMDGTEIGLESTANGVTGEFYERTQDAVRGIGDYRVCFIPWYLQTEYCRIVPEGFELSTEVPEGSLFSEVEYMEQFGLTLGQMVWRRNKINELRSASLFDQEYPASLELAFQQSMAGAYHKPQDIMRARKRPAGQGAGPLILGVDPAGEGGDRFAVAARRGYEVEWVKYREKIEHDEAVEWVKSLIDQHDPAVVFIDAGGIGKAIISTLRGKGPRYGAPHVRPVNFGATSQAKLARPKMPGPKNRRAEMQERLKQWLALPEGVKIPDMDALQADLIEIKIKRNLTNDLQLESKPEMRARGVRSSDLADAVGLTFADTTFIAEYSGPKKPQTFSQIDTPPDSVGIFTENGGGGGSWMI